MSSLLLTTKLYLPPALDAFIERPRLAARLNAGLSQGHPLILVSAPAGFGKSTLLSQWLVEICQQGVQVAWLSLDPGDNDLQRFLSYLLATFQRARPGLGSEAGAMLSADFSIPYETILTSLLNEIGEDSTELILALDDYHVITNLDVHQALRFLLEALPQNLHLVLAGRVDPPLPLARLRARGLLTELRLKDLRFTHAEMDEMIRTITGLELGEEDLAALEERTEGWGAGLRLATISLEERPGREARPAGRYDFSGSERHAMDYIIDEVLCCLPQNVRTFLLQTSVLEQFSSALCQAVVEGESSDAQGGTTWTPLSPQDVITILDFVEKSNLFLVPLDAQGEWFRFHHLFQQALQHQLRQEHPERVPELHKRAAAWLAAQVASGGCAQLEDEWVFNIADLVVQGQTVTNDGARLLQIRFYPVATTTFIR